MFPGSLFFVVLKYFNQNSFIIKIEKKFEQRGARQRQSRGIVRRDMGPFCAPPSAFPLGRYIKCAVASSPPRFHTGGAKGIVVGEALRVQPKKTFFPPPPPFPPRRQKMQGNKFPGDAFLPLSPFLLFVSHLRCSHCRRRPKERERG